MNDTSVDAETLFRDLKREAERIPQELIPKPRDHRTDVSDVSQAMSKYDLDVFREILSLDHVEADHGIDRHELEDFILKIEHYMDAQAPGRDQLKKYVRIISTYLVFIARRPLHSPDIAFFGNRKIVKKNNAYYCPAKSVYIKEKDSLCKYCVCKIEKGSENKK
jgi:uncharacterized protein (UPF0305 family)